MSSANTKGSVTKEDKSKKELIEKVDHIIPLTQLCEKYKTNLHKGLDDSTAA